MRLILTGLGVLLTAFVLLACGSDSDGAGGSDGPGGGSGPGGDDRAAPSGNAEGLSYLRLSPIGLIEGEIESGDELGLGGGESLTLARLFDDSLWAAAGPWHLIQIDPASGDVAHLNFGSTQTITDYVVDGGLVWVQAGFAFGDAVLLAVDRTSGGLVFTIEPPAGTSIGGIAVGEEGVWLIGGDPELSGAVSRVDGGSGIVSGSYDAKLIVRYLAVGFGGVWVGGSDFEFEGGQGDAVVRLDPESGAEVARIQIGDTLRAILPYNGAIWVVDSLGADSGGAQLHRIDPETNTITDTIEIGAPGNGSLDLVAGGGFIFAMNSTDRETYVINAETAEGEIILSGGVRPAAIW